MSEAVYEDFGHLFDNGNKIVARRIAEELTSCGLFVEREKTDQSQ